MSVALIADAHLGGPGGAPGPLLEQLDELAGRGCEQLVLLGDIFHIWVALPKFETEEIRVVLEALRDLRATAGMRIAYIEGNRDFFLRTGRTLAGAFDVVGRELVFEQSGVRYLAVHGDGLNEKDRQYLLWRWLSKSALARVAMKAIPAAVAQRLVAGTERRLARTNFKHRQRLPEAAIEAFGSARLGEGHDVVLLGHFHAPRRWTTELGEIRLIEPWFMRRHVEWLR